MTITREQVADLRAGDVIELWDDSHPGVVTRGPLRDNQGELFLGRGFCIRDLRGDVFFRERSIRVISRAPRPLYVNHDRTEPAEGDIVRDCDGDAWRFEEGEWWCASVGGEDDDPDGFPITAFRPLRLLWDGAEGRAVSS